MHTCVVSILLGRKTDVNNYYNKLSSWYITSNLKWSPDKNCWKYVEIASSKSRKWTEISVWYYAAERFLVSLKDWQGFGVLQIIQTVLCWLCSNKDYKNYVNLRGGDEWKGEMGWGGYWCLYK